MTQLGYFVQSGPVSHQNFDQDLKTKQKLIRINKNTERKQITYCNVCVIVDGFKNPVDMTKINREINNCFGKGVCNEAE